MKRYENAIKAILQKEYKELSFSDKELLAMAYDCDQSLQNLIDDSRRFQKYFGEYTESLLSGRIVDCPSKYGSLSDLTSNSAFLAAKSDALATLVRASYGLETAKRFMTELRNQ